MKSRAEQIEDSIEDIRYEVTTLLQASEFYHQARLKRDWSPDLDKRDIGKAVCNFTIESFLLHYRNLNEFLHNMGTRDSVNAKDYAPAWQYKRNPRPGSNAKQHPKLADETEMRRIHQRLAHISGSRSELDTHWMIPQMFERVCDAFEEFVRAVPDPQKGRFAEAINAIQKHRALTVETVLPVSANRTDSVKVLPSPGLWAMDFKITK
jgi:hypothetical protein